MPRNNAQDAMELAGLGWQIMPLHTWADGRCDCRKADCPSPAKHPRTFHGLKDATADLAQIARWWAQWPAANIGVRTGAASGLAVMDIDPRHEGQETWLALMAERDFAHSGPMCQTGSGGMHLYFAYPDDGRGVPNSAGQLGQGLDVRGDGGYVVVPPSVHKAGTSYYWVEGHAPWDREADAVPDWLLELMRQRPERPAGEGGGADARGPIPAGRRRTDLLSLGGKMRHWGMGEAAIFNALAAENAERCVPPLDVREVAGLAKDIAQRYEPGAVTILPSPRVLKETAKRRAQYEPDPQSFAALRSKQIPDLRWAVPGLLPQGAAMLSGAPKLGKSYWCLQLVFAVGAGGEAFDYLPTEAGACLYLALEDSERRLQNRGRALAGDGEWPGHAYYETRWPRIDEGGREALETWLGQHPETRLVVVDTLAMFKPEQDGSGKRRDVYADDYACIRVFKEVADLYGVCVLLVTHVNKGEHADWLHKQTGSTGQTGSADTILQIDRPEGRRSDDNRTEAVLRMTGRDVAENTWMMQRLPEGFWRIAGDVAEALSEKQNHETVHFMQMLWADGYQEVTARLLGTVSNKKHTTCNQMLIRAAREGVIQRVRQGVYALSQEDIPR